MKRLKVFEDFKVNNITIDDIIDCIDSNGVIYADIVHDLPENDPKIPLNPVDVDVDGLITVNIDGNLYYVDLDDVNKIETNPIQENKKISIVDENLRDHVPQSLSIVTSNGEFNLVLSDCWVQFPKVCLSYWHSTPDKTGDVLTDGEPDYLCLDLNFLKKENQFEINVENTYGDAMMFEFKISTPNNVEIGHYNGYKSKVDPNYFFGYTEESIGKLVDFFNSFTFGLQLTRDKFNFLDLNPNSYKTEKVSHRIVTNFSKF